MDTPTQALLGALTSQLGFRQRIGRDAPWVAALVAALPDIDSFAIRVLGIKAAGQTDLAVMAYHRGITHSLLVVPVLAAVAAAIWWVLRRRRARRTDQSPPPFWLLYACCFVAALSQPLLDLFTSYGTQLLTPLTNRRFAIDAVPIVDVIYTPILILTLAGCYIARKLSANWRGLTARIAWAGMLLSSGYIATGAALGALAEYDARLAWDPPNGPARYRAMPVIPTIFVWRVVRQTPESWSVMRVNVLYNAEPGERAQDQAPVPDNQWIRRARELPAVRIYEWFSMDQLRPTYRLEGDRHVVEFHDMRYGFPAESAESLWPMRVVFDADGQVVQTGRHWRHSRPGSFGRIARQAWGYLWQP